MIDLTIGRAIRIACESNASSTAMIFEDQKISFEDFYSKVNKVANTLIQLGFKVGDKVALLLPNSPLYLEVVCGAASVGVGVVLLNYRFTTTEINYHIKDSEAKALIFDESFQEKIIPLESQIKSLQLIPVQKSNYFKINLNDLLEVASDQSPHIIVRESDLLMLQYTSGTTGNPKGAMITHRNRCLAFLHWPSIFGYGSKDSILHTGPFHHSAPLGMTLSQLCIGGSVVIMPAFNTHLALELISKYKVTWSFMVPFMFQAIASEQANSMDAFDCSSLRVLLSGASPLPTVVKESILKIFPKAGLFEFYGATEAGTITTLRPEDQSRKFRSVGKAVLGAEVKIVNEFDLHVGVEEIGEIFLKTPSMFEGYFKAEDKTKSAFKDGWCTLGDLGKFDDEGYLYIVDRLKDVIKSGGVNIYPSEIEEVLLSHDCVQDAAVIGVPHEKWGESVHAILVMKSGKNYDEVEIKQFMRNKLAGYKIPKSIQFRASLPRSAAGKILKRELRDEYWKEGIKV